LVSLEIALGRNAFAAWSAALAERSALHLRAVRGEYFGNRVTRLVVVHDEDAQGARSRISASRGAPTVTAPHAAHVRKITEPAQAFCTASLLGVGADLDLVVQAVDSETEAVGQAQGRTRSLRSPQTAQRGRSSGRRARIVSSIVAVASRCICVGAVANALGEEIDEGFLELR
jgi:hypothetical protein